jgi:Protein of unknown function (DUF1997)
MAIAMNTIYLCRWTLLAVGLACSLNTSAAFVQPTAFRSLKLQDDARCTKIQRHSGPLFLSSRVSPAELQRRNQLLQRNGPFFQLNRMGGQVEFGATANLVTKLNPQQPDLPAVQSWLGDERRVALSIWDEKLIQELGQNVFKLKVMKLQFVTIQLQPSVDVKMWTEVSSDGNPTFRLQSVAFEPNLQVLPGINLSASSLGIKIEVVGELQPTPDGKGVTGKITFTTSGILPPPMRLLPEPVLKAASDTINQTITQFAIQSFQRGAIAKYQEFLKTKL